MHRAIPAASKICAERDYSRQMEKHREKVRGIKPTVDNKAPSRYTHLIQNWKKIQTDEERYSKIDHDNRILLRKMTEIMQRSTLDNQNLNYTKRSLNRERRRRELARITEENSRLLQRLLQGRPTYDHVSWEEERKRNELYCRSICQYPFREWRDESGGGLAEGGANLSTSGEAGPSTSSNSIGEGNRTGNPLNQSQQSRRRRHTTSPPKRPTRLSAAAAGGGGEGHEDAGAGGAGSSSKKPIAVANEEDEIDEDERNAFSDDETYHSRPTDGGGDTKENQKAADEDGHEEGAGEEGHE